MITAFRKYLLDLPVWMSPRFPLRGGPAAWYDVSDVNSMLNNAGAVPSSGDGIKLLADKSGNSAVNVLCLNALAGNTASSPNSAALDCLRTNFTADFYGDADDWTPAAVRSMFSQTDGAANKVLAFQLNTNGRPYLDYSIDGTNSLFANATAAPAFTDYGYGALRVTRNSTTGEIKFYSSTDGISFTLINTVAGTSGTLFDGTNALEIGRVTGFGGWAGRVRRVRIKDGYDDTGTVQFDSNFATFSKLAATGTESSANAATVTINTSGATGARISGARDLYQGTAANQPILTIAATGNYLTFDGSNDYLKAAAFALVQPITGYAVCSQASWSINDVLFDGNATSIQIGQLTATPRLGIPGGSGNTFIDSFAVGTTGVLSWGWNAGSSFIRRNRDTADAGTGPSTAPNGFTIGANGSGAQNANITVSEVLIRSAADATYQQDPTIRYFLRKWRIAE